MKQADLIRMQKAAKDALARKAQAPALRAAERLHGGGGGLDTAPSVRYEPLKPRLHHPVGHHTDARAFIQDRRAGFDRPEAVRRVGLPIPAPRESYTPVPLMLTSDRLIQDRLDKFWRG